MNPNDLLADIHNNLSPEAIHLALHDLEGNVSPETTLVDFLERLFDVAQDRDNRLWADRLGQ